VEALGGVICLSLQRLGFVVHDGPKASEPFTAWRLSDGLGET
jgi:hypothetical protein